MGNFWLYSFKFTYIFVLLIVLHFLYFHDLTWYHFTSAWKITSISTSTCLLLSNFLFLLSKVLIFAFISSPIFLLDLKIYLFPFNTLHILFYFLLPFRPQLLLRFCTTAWFHYTLSQFLLTVLMLNSFQITQWESTMFWLTLPYIHQKSHMPAHIWVAKELGSPL